MTNNGVDYPIERDVDVITVMAAVVPQNLPVNLASPPIGPHRAGLTRRFDPSNAIDRQDAAKIFCPRAGCDVSLRVTRGGVTKTYMLDAGPIALHPGRASQWLAGCAHRTRRMGGRCHELDAYGATQTNAPNDWPLRRLRIDKRSQSWHLPCASTQCAPA